MSLTGAGEIATFLGKILDRVVPDKNAAAQAKAELEKIAASGELEEMRIWSDLMGKQLQVNANEAANTSVFVAGWRPFIGWICGTALGLQFVAFPLATWAAALTGHPFTPPPMDAGALWNITLGMLGMAGWRTLEKVKGASK